MVGIESEIRLFQVADDCVCYRQIGSIEDISKLQKDIDQLGKWARKWGVRFHLMTYNMMQLSRKRIKKIKLNAVYLLEGTVLENVDNIKNMGVTISKDLKWNTHVSNVCTQASRTLAFLRLKLSSCPQDDKEMYGKPFYYLLCKKKVREKSRECHNHKPFPDPKRKRKPTNPNKHKWNKRTKSTKISSLFPKRGNCNTKRTEKHKNKMTHKIDIIYYIRYLI